MTATLGTNGSAGASGGWEVHQFLPSAGARDAVGAHTLQSARALAAAGLNGGIWAEDIQADMAKDVRATDVYETFRPARRRSNIILYQLATGSRAFVSRLVGWPEPKMIYFHNITPSRFFDPWAPDEMLNMAWGREELKLLAPHVAVALANSEFSAAELRELGIEDVRVIPPYLPPALDTEPDPAHLDWLQRTKRGLDVLCVSRLVPHKGHLDLLRAFAALRAAVDPNARLLLVGPWGPEPYMRAIFRLRDRLNVEGVLLTGSVSAATLAAHYRHADVFVSLSRHEGFGLPLIEAMRQGLPVVAYDAAAVAETMDGAGVLLGTLDPTVVAEVVVRAGQPGSLRGALVRRQRERVARLDAVPRDRLLVEACLAVTAGAGAARAATGRVGPEVVAGEAAGSSSRRAL
ncbi:MAG: glycosyltransferase [Actinomycetota bacterium]|nr:glycosyltransferase [Actinomycetota bacterium]